MIRDVFAGKIRECKRRWRYIPDAEGRTPLERLLNDVWETPEEVEARGGADCDGLSVWALVRAYESVLGVVGPTDLLGEWALVAGEVSQQRAWLGHAWCELILPDGARLWGDPTWGWPPTSPAQQGYGSTRRPKWRWAFTGTIFAGQEGYVEVPA